MPWTSVAKPTTPTWTNDNSQGKEQYDQSDITYDQADIYYDGVNPNQWTEVSKPSQGYDDLTWEEMAMSWSNADQSWGGNNPWSKVMKPQ